LSLNEDRHDRVAGLFEAVQERPDWKNTFNWFVECFLDRCFPERDRMPLKRFLALHGEEFNKKHPVIFKTICQELVRKLKLQPDNLASQKLLIGLVGQPYPLTPVAFARGFLSVAGDRDRVNFIKYGYKEAIEEGLKGEYQYGGKLLWAAMVRTFPNQFPGEYPSTDGAHSFALKDFKPTKQDREEAWAKENTPILLEHLEMLVTELQLPLYRDLLFVIAGYAITWVVV